MNILLFKAHAGDLLSLAIREVTQSEYCHAAILLDASSPWRKVFGALCGLQVSEVDQRPMIIEEYWPKARARYLAEHELAGIDVFKIADWNDENETLAMRYASQVVRDEIKYDIPDLFRFGPLFRLVMGASNETEAKRHMFCSYFVFELCKVAGRPLLNVCGSQVSPNMLAWPTQVLPSAFPSGEIASTTKEAA